MNKFYNIDEQRLWNDNEHWIDHEQKWAGNYGSTENIWNKVIFDKIKNFRNKRILEIAPGYGRMTQFLSILASNLQIVDLNENCIEYTKSKLGHHVNSYFVNDGKSLPVGDNSQDLVFSYDSFVHMHQNVIEDYIKEIYRVLSSGGQGFIHHSDLYGGGDLSFKNIGGRSNMNCNMFNKLIYENGMIVLSQDPIIINPIVTDYITIFMKP
jgi:ubiquinone/menaquinone biosynthesis C-methylase UbiE